MAKALKKLNLTSTWIKNPFVIKQGLIGSDDLGEEIFAHLLQDLERFYVDLEEIRKSIHLKKLITFPINPNLKTLIYLKGQLSDDGYIVLKKELRRLMIKIGVAENWQLPLEVLVLTHVLLVPSKQEALSLHLPDTHPPLYFADPSGSLPKILLQRPFTIEEFHRWVDDNKKILKETSHKLPRDPRRSNNLKTLLLSRIIFTLKEEDHKTSKQIADLLPIIYGKLGMKPLDRTIDYKEVDDIYNGYKKYLKSIYKSES